MRLGVKSRFAVSAMTDVALREQSGPVSLTAISERQQISVSYLEQIFSQLRKHGLVQSTRGPSGGYSLCRAANAISVAEIVSAVESKPFPSFIEAGVPGTTAEADMAKDLWDAVHSNMLAYLKAVTLRDLADEQRAKGLKISLRPAAMRGIFAKRKDKAPLVTAPNSVFALAGR